MSNPTPILTPIARTYRATLYLASDRHPNEQSRVVSIRAVSGITAAASRAQRAADRLNDEAGPYPAGTWFVDRLEDITEGTRGLSRD